MAREENLLKFYPQSNRPIDDRGNLITEQDRAIARKFDVEYFDGDRLTGYGGYNYNPRFWTDTVAHIKDFYHLDDNSKTKFKIVGDDEAEIEKGLLSYRSPVAKSLIGKEKGDFVTVTTPKGEKNYEIKKITYE